MQDFLNLAVGASMAIFGWAAKEIWSAIQKLKADVQKLEVAMPSHYVRKDDFAEWTRRVENKLDRIADKLDGKLDKAGNNHVL